MKKIIFFPIEIGLAHITRSLAVATELKKRGHDILFAIPQRKKMLAEKTGLKTGEIIEYTNTDEIKFAENLKNESFLLKQVKSELVLIDQFKPDYAVVDFRISALTSCSLRNVPMFFLTGSGGLPYGCYLPNTGFSPFLHSILSPVFQTIIWKMKKRYFNRLAILTKKLGRNLDETTLIKAMIYVVPEAPTYLPALDERLKIHYVGPIFWKGFNSYNPKWLSSIKPNGKTVYISFGGTGFNSQKLIGLSTELVNAGYGVVVSSSTIADVDEFPRHKNLFVAKYLPGFEISSRVDAVICHGGYGTIMQAVMSGKPVITIPFNPDQLLHAWRFEELGLGKSMVRFNFKFLFDFYNSNWLAFQNLADKVEVKDILKTLREILRNKGEYKKCIDTFNSTMPKKNGAEMAADVIESNFLSFL